MFRLDKTKFWTGKVEDQENFVNHWMSKTPLERLEASWFLTCSAFGYDYKNPPALDKTLFSKRTRK